MQADFLLDYDVITVEREQKLYLMARLVAGPAPDQTNRRPLNLSLVIDRSGSMAGSKIDYTRQAASLLVQNLSIDDTFSMVLYNETVETFLAPQRVEHKDLLRQRIDNIKAGGTTNLSGGWLEGINHVQNHLSSDQVNRVILMSDGLANRGITDAEQLVMIARQKRETGVSTTTMGLGEDFNEDLLIDIADAGGGAFYFIESPEVTPGIFQEELKGLLTLVGQNLNISIRPTSYVTQVRQMNAFPEERTGSDTRFRVGDVYGEEIKSLMLELTIPAMKEIGEVQIATVRFEYDELRDSGSERKSMEMPVRVNVAPPHLAPGEENVEVKRSALLLKAADARREAIKLADEGKFGEAGKVLRDAAEEIRKANLQDDALQEERTALIAQAADMDKGQQYYQSYSRKSMSTQVYFTGHGSHENTQALRFREQQRKDGVGQTSMLGNNNENDESVEARKTFYFENPLAKIATPPSPPSNPPTKTPPTHMRWNDQVFPLDADLIRIGRAPQNEIILNTSGISRFHCQIQREGGQLIIEDLNSTNGTHIGGRAIHQPHILHDGDVIYLCDQRIIFERQS